MSNHNVINLFENINDTQYFISNHPYKTLIDRLALRITEQYNYVHINNIPINLDDVGLNETIIRSMANKFSKSHQQILFDIHVSITPLLSLEG